MPTSRFRLKRIYEPPSRDDGFRVLVERLWPRGMKKEDAHLDLWLKEVSPSPELRRWYKHDVKKWPEFRRRYTAELKANPEPVALLRDRAKKGNVTLLYAARDEEHNSAVVLKEYLGVWRALTRLRRSHGRERRTRYVAPELTAFRAGNPASCARGSPRARRTNR